jgi:hypothetical protein
MLSSGSSRERLYRGFARGFVGGIAFACLIESAYATTYNVDPRSYLERLAQLKPGDRLQLAPGTYRDGLSINGIHGSNEQPIVIEGSSSGAPTVFQGVSGRNTVSLRNASFVEIKNLMLDGGGLDVDGVKAEHGGGVVHHITLEGLTIIGHGGDQQTVGISTKTPATNWTIRNNLIIGAGTGMYFGGSDGSAPFISGLIESNVIVDTLGYNLQIKHQRTRPLLSQLPPTAQRTVIRGNVFSKAANASTGKSARPNVLVGHFPPGGVGSDDEYQIVGNVFLSNPEEALFQGEGNLLLRRNVFLNPVGPAVVVQPHQGVPRRITIENNFVVGLGAGIELTGVDPRFVPAVARNRLFALPIAADNGRADRSKVPPEAQAEFASWLDPGFHAPNARDDDRDVLVAAIRRACQLTVGANPLLRATPLSLHHYVCRAAQDAPAER